MARKGGVGLLESSKSDLGSIISFAHIQYADPVNSLFCSKVGFPAVYRSYRYTAKKAYHCKQQSGIPVYREIITSFRFIPVLTVKQLPMPLETLSMSNRQLLQFYHEIPGILRDLTSQLS